MARTCCEMLLVLAMCLLGNSCLATQDDGLLWNNAGHRDASPQPALKLDPILRRALLRALTQLELEAQRKAAGEPADHAPTEDDGQEVNIKRDLEELLGNYENALYPSSTQRPDDTTLLERPDDRILLDDHSSQSADVSVLDYQVDTSNTDNDNLQDKPQESAIFFQDPVEPQTKSEAPPEAGSAPQIDIQSNTIPSSSHMSEQDSNAVATDKNAVAKSNDASTSSKSDLEDQDVSIFQAPLVAAFTLQQDEKGNPRSVVPLLRRPQGTHRFQQPSQQQQQLELTKQQQRFQQQQLELTKQQQRFQQQQLELTKQQQRFQPQPLQLAQQQRFQQQQLELTKQQQRFQPQPLQLAQQQRFEPPQLSQQQQRFQPQALELTQQQQRFQPQALELTQQQQRFQPQQLELTQQQRFQPQQLELTQQQQRFQPQQLELTQQQRFRPQQLELTQQQRFRPQQLELTQQQAAREQQLEHKTRLLEQQLLQQQQQFQQQLLEQQRVRFQPQRQRPQRQETGTAIVDFQESLNTQLQSLLYQSGVAGDLQSNGASPQEDLNIVSKILSLNHEGRGPRAGRETPERAAVIPPSRFITPPHP